MNKEIDNDTLLDKAIHIATLLHKGQVDKGGLPYLNHCIRVMDRVTTTKGKIVAILHDIIEDTHITKEELINEGFPLDIIEAIELLTKPKKEDYLRYIRRVKQNSLAKEVKLADLQDNMDLTRLKNISQKDINRFNLYKKAYDILSS